MTPAHFDALYAAMFEYAKDRELFIKATFGGADHRLPVRIITELAWHSLFAHQLLIRPDAAQLLAFAEMRTHPYFRFLVPISVESTDSDILNPRGTWADESAYDIPAIKLVGMFRENFKKFEAHVRPRCPGRGASPATIV
jgi:ATP-dependent phosphoenolpyruvate carboxykinase